MSFTDPRFNPILSNCFQKKKPKKSFTASRGFLSGVVFVTLSEIFGPPSFSAAASLSGPTFKISPQVIDCQGSGALFSGHEESLPPGTDPKTAIRIWLFDARFLRDTPDRKAMGREALRKAQSGVEAALKSFPRDATLLALHGEWNLLMVQYKGFPGGMAFGKNAESLNGRALALDPENPEAHLSRGIELYFKPWFVGGSVRGALKEFETASSLRPRDARILSWIGIAKKKLHRPGALDAEKEAVKACPNSPLYSQREKTFNPRSIHP